MMKTLDALIGRLIVSLLVSPARRGIPADILSILLIRPGGIGDAVLLAPAIHSIRNNYPLVRITILAERRNAGVFPLVPEVDEVLCYDRPLEFYLALSGRYDIVIDTEQWHRLSAVVARIVRAPVKIGFDSNERRRMFTHTLPYSHEEYEAVSFATLLLPLKSGGWGGELTAQFLYIPAAASEKAAVLLRSLNGNKFVAIFPGASIVERRWGADRFGQISVRLVEAGFKVVVVGGREDREDGDVIAGAEGGLNLAGITNLAETAAVIALSTLLISGDSGVLHLAVGLDIPTVSLFGPGIAAKWAPRGEKHVVLNQNLSCSPCTRFGSTSPCPEDARCMKEITAGQVMAAAVGFLK
ncbi:MAG: glycosyltransferase family 9 protein [Desulfuromonadaceae bacterium]|nr:glycosyltransferase family 9 protein [Desulfuromonadaceae bacterium]